ALGLQYSKDSLVKQASEGDTIGVRLLLIAGIDPDVHDSGRNTALGAAALGGYLETVQLLLARGAHVDNRNGQNETALIQAAANGRADVVKFLLDRGADASAVDSFGKSPLLAGAKFPGVVEALLEKGANANAKSLGGDTPLRSAVREGAL